MKNQFISCRSFETPLYIAPSAWLEHIPFAFELISKQQPKIIVELGVHYGASYFSFCQAVQANNLTCKCYAIDSWTGDEHAGFYGASVESAFYVQAIFNALSSNAPIAGLAGGGLPAYCLGWARYPCDSSGSSQAGQLACRVGEQGRQYR